MIYIYKLYNNTVVSEQEGGFVAPLSLSMLLFVFLCLSLPLIDRSFSPYGATQQKGKLPSFSHALAGWERLGLTSPAPQ